MSLLAKDKVTEFFCLVDDFFQKYYHGAALSGKQVPDEAIYRILGDCFVVPPRNDGVK